MDLLHYINTDLLIQPNNKSLQATESKLTVKLGQVNIWSAWETMLWL